MARRDKAGARGLLGLSLAMVVPVGLGSCGEGNPGIDPPLDQLAFPSGLLLDPRVDSSSSGPCESDEDCAAADELCGGGGQCRAPARWLFITNANSDRRYNGGSMVALDVDAYWQAAFSDPGAIADATTSLACGGLGDEDCRPCRRVANLPQVVECMEEPFVDPGATIYFGNFPGPTRAWDEDPGDDQTMLLVPVRGDPSITYAMLSGDDSPRLDCNQGADPDQPRRCADANRLRFLRNDPDASRLSREPFRVLVSPQPELPLAYVSHQGDPDMTLIALKGLSTGGDGRPAIVHQANVLEIGASPAIEGGFGLAYRPCEVDSDNAPESTLGCSRPLVYGALRWVTSIQTVTAVSHEPIPGSDQECVGPDEIDKAGGIICEPQLEPLERFGVPVLSTQGVPTSTSRPLLADIEFSRSGNELYVVQSNPGALIRLDTSIAVDGEPLNGGAGQVEVCSQPTTLALYDDGENEYGVVTCYRSGEVFIVDLTSMTVVGLARAGSGPDAIAPDIAREVAFVANSLDATISIIDMSRTSPTRFTEIGRIGLPEPYSQ